jgi:hypothetical protein
MREERSNRIGGRIEPLEGPSIDESTSAALVPAPVRLYDLTMTVRRAIVPLLLFGLLAVSV